jgi:hypothetical protein
VFFTRKRLRLYLGALLLLQCVIVPACWKIVKEGSIDFRLFYTAGHIVRSGNAPNLYDYDTQLHFQNASVTPNAYALTLMEPPFVALAFLPLSFLHYLAAYLAFFAIDLVLLALAVIIMRPHLRPLSARSPSAPALLFFSFFPAGIALAQGQISLILLALYCLTFVELERGKPLLAGAIFSLALLKFQIALPVVLLFLLWRRWRFIAGFSAGAAVLGSISLAMIGPSHLAAFVHSLFSTPAALSTASAQVKYAVYPQRMPNLYGFFYMLSAGHHWGVILTAISSLLLLLWAARKPASLPLAALVALLVSYHLYIHDLSLLLLPLSLLVSQQLAAGSIAPHDRRRLAGVSALAILLISPVTIFLISSNWLPLLAIPIAVLTLTLGPTLRQSTTEEAPTPLAPTFIAATS